MKWNESGFRPPLCTYRLNWARRTSWGWWDDWDDTVLQTQDSKFEPWRSEAEHATSRSRRLPTILTFTRGWGRNNFVSFKPPRPGTEPRTLAWKAAVLTTTLGPPPNIFYPKLFSSRHQMTSDQPTYGESGFMHKWTNPHFYHLSLCKTGATHILTAVRTCKDTQCCPKRKRFHAAIVVVRTRDDITLFCDNYTMFFFMFLIDFFVLNSSPISASLKSLSIFIDSRSKVNLKVKYDFSRDEARNKCNTSFPCDFDWAIHFGNYYSRSFSRPKGQFQGQARENISFNK